MTGERWPAFCRGLTAPKSESRPEDNEDAFAAAPADGRFAVVDGATQSGFAAEWARILAEGFVRYRRAELQNGSWLDPLRKQWTATVDPLDLPWYLADRRTTGAYAAFLGVDLLRDPAGGGTWTAVSVGDSCLFQIRDKKLISAFPLDRSDQFTAFPSLIGSRPEGNDSVPWKADAGSWRPNDWLLLMTDALACWFLSRVEVGERPFAALRRRIHCKQAASAFAAAVVEWRTTQGLKDDDATLLAIRV